jgi:DDE superfamily endonuclease
MALVDADYKFLFVDVGTNGRISDGGVYAKTALATLLENNALQVPSRRILPGRTKPRPYVIVADEAFPLKSYIMKPYNARSINSNHRRVFNYRLSRARRVVENAFGIMANRFRVFLNRIPMCPRKVQIVVLAACVLHNFLRVKCSTSFDSLIEKEDDATGFIAPSAWRELSSNDSWNKLAPDNTHRCTDYAADVREEFCEYFSNQGSVPWQDRMLRDY